jgi:predicted negative regulator of RcsB-dependent stress response
MQSDASPSSGSVAFFAWVEVNKQRLIIGGAAAVVIFFGGFLFVQHQAQKEAVASAALSDVRLPYSTAVAVPAGASEALAKVAEEHSGTRAAARALLIGAGILFSEANSPEGFAKAEQQFARVTKEYPESAWMAQANLGIAASLAAQGKTAEAVTKYEEIRRRFANSPIINQATLALARLYEKDKREEAFKLFEELTKEGGNNIIGMEANVRQDALLKAHPELAKLREPVIPPPSAISPVQIMPLTNRVMNAVSNVVNGVKTNIQTITVTNRPAGSQTIPIKVSPTPSPGAANPAPSPAPAPAK